MWKLAHDLQFFTWEIFYSDDGDRYDYVCSRTEGYLKDKCKEITSNPGNCPFGVGGKMLYTDDAKEFVRVVMKKLVGV